MSNRQPITVTRAKSTAPAIGNGFVDIDAMHKKVPAAAIAAKPKRAFLSFSKRIRIPQIKSALAAILHPTTNLEKLSYRNGLGLESQLAAKKIGQVNAQYHAINRRECRKIHGHIFH